jgi:uncharacterized protein involved in exopolysaccharide biosynthesis
VTALAADGRASSNYVTPTQVWRALVRRGRFLLLSLALVVSVTTAVLLVLPQWYTASVLLAPEAPGTALPAELAGLASMAGLSLGTATQGPQFYVPILTSRPLTDAVLSKKFPVGFDTPVDSVELLELLQPPGRTELERHWNATRMLTRRMGVTADLRTGLIRLEVTLRSPQTAAAVANQFAVELNRFNAEVRQSQARVRRQFIEARVSEVSADLVAAEEAARVFLAENRDFQNSPRLMFEYGRLERAVNTQEALYLDLERQLNAARIEEVDDIPAVTTIEQAIPPQRKSRPRRRLWLSVVTAASLIVLSGYVVIREYWKPLLGVDEEPSTL